MCISDPDMQFQIFKNIISDEILLMLIESVSCLSKFWFGVFSLMVIHNDSGAEIKE